MSSSTGTGNKKCGLPKKNGQPCGQWCMHGKEACVTHLAIMEKKAKQEMSKAGSPMSGSDVEFPLKGDWNNGVNLDGLLLKTVGVVDSLREEKFALQVRIKEIAAMERKLKNQVSVMSAAKLLAYHDLKKLDTILKDLTERLSSVGLLDFKKDGQPKLPWRLVKKYTDMMFDEMSEEEKAPYIAKAEQKLMGKVLTKVLTKVSVAA